MRITNATLTVPKNDSRSWLERVGRELSVHLPAGRYPLRAAIARLTDREAVIESTFVELDPRDPYRERFTDIELTSPRRKDHQAVVGDAVSGGGHLERTPGVATVE